MPLQIFYIDKIRKIRSIFYITEFVEILQKLLIYLFMFVSKFIFICWCCTVYNAVHFCEALTTLLDQLNHSQLLHELHF